MTDVAIIEYNDEDTMRPAKIERKPPQNRSQPILNTINQLLKIYQEKTEILDKFLQDQNSK